MEHHVGSSVPLFPPPRALRHVNDGNDGNTYENDGNGNGNGTTRSSTIQLGHVDFVIKVYKPNVEPRFPEGGKMSMHLERLQVRMLAS